MSNDDLDIDIENSENDPDFKSRIWKNLSEIGYYSQADKRAYHNPLKRKREHIKDSFTSLRESIPALQNEKVAEKRARHNAFERKKRLLIRNNFILLKESVPVQQNEKVANRTQMLKKTAEYIQFKRQKNDSHRKDIEDLKRKIELLDNQIAEDNSKILASSIFPHNVPVFVAERELDLTASRTGAYYFNHHIYYDRFRTVHLKE